MRETQEGGDMGDLCICIADSLCYKAETNTPLESNYTPVKMLKIIIIILHKIQKFMKL